MPLPLVRSKYFIPFSNFTSCRSVYKYGVSVVSPPSAGVMLPMPVNNAVSSCRVTRLVVKIEAVGVVALF